MDFTVEKLEKSQSKFSFVADKATFDAAVYAAYANNKRKYASYNAPGFRKGHVPVKVIIGMYGIGVFFEDAVHELIDEAIEQLHATGEYSIVEVLGVDDVDMTDDGGAKFTLNILLTPEVKLGAYKGLTVEKRAVNVADEQVEAELKVQQEKQARLVDIDGEAAIGNSVNLDYAGTVDGVAFEGGTAENYTLELGSNTFIPGFEEQLVGVKAGDVKDVNVTFPEDYPSKDVAGKPAVFKCTIHSVQKVELPELDDDFATTVSDFDTLAEYKESVKARLVKEDEEAIEREYENALIEQIVKNAEVDVPEEMIKLEVEDMMAEFEHRLSHQGLTLDIYTQYTGVTREQMENDFNETAKRNVPTRLVLDAILKAEDIKLEDADVDARLQEYAEESGEDIEHIREHMQPELMQYLLSSALSKKLVDAIKSYNSADAEVKPAKKSRAKKAAEPAEETKVAETAEEEKPVKKTRAKKAAEPAEEPKVAEAAPAKKKSAKKAKADESEGE